MLSQSLSTIVDQMKSTYFITIATIILGMVVAVGASSPYRQSTANGGQGCPPSPFQTFLASIREARKHLVAAGVARGVSIFGMYPVDTIKVSPRVVESTQFLSHDELSPKLFIVSDQNSSWSPEPFQFCGRIRWSWHITSWSVTIWRIDLWLL